MKIAKIIFLLLIFSVLPNQTFLSKCSEGCLSCDTSSKNDPKCTICDHFNFYRLTSSGSCFKMPLENCEIPSSDPSFRVCNLCKPGFFMDNTGNKCSLVPEKFRVASCRRYHWEYSCSECEQNFYLMRNTCLPVLEPVHKCEQYADAKTCIKCEEGHFLNIGTKTCDPIKTKVGCLVYSSVECTQCASGHFKMENIFSSLSSSPSLLQTWTSYSSAQFIFEKTNFKNPSIFEPQPSNHCVQGSVKNCLRHFSFNECAECEDDYFLSPSKTCESFPVRTVAHCQAYKTANICSRCVAGFYLNDNVCVSLNDVDGCLEFDPITEDCVECDQEKFYFQNGSCGRRINSFNISFCVKTSENDDFCEKCLPSFKLTDDKLKCLPHIPHCEDYVSNNSVIHEDHTNISTLELKCVSCEEHFYLSANKKLCLTQNSPGCLEFTPNTNKCSQCASGYFLNNFACELYTKKFCKSFETNSDACSDCFDGFFLSDNSCIKYTARNCLTYESNSDNCASCLGQYYLSTSGSPPQTNCDIITVRNCKSFKKTGDEIENECQECYQGYQKENKECVLVALLNCAVQTPSSNQCQTCKGGYFNDNGTCRPYTVKNCDSYETSKDECVTCASSFGSGDKRNMFYKNSQKECLPYTVLNCETKHDDKNECATCPSSNWYINAHGDCVASHLKHCSALDPSNAEQCQTCADGFKKSHGRCFKINLAGCVEYSENNCQTCAQGFYKNNNKCYPYTVSNCATYETALDACNTCLPGFKKDSNDCVFFHEDHCKTFDSSGTCTECHHGYFKAASSCDPQNIAFCIKYTPNQNHCMECRVGYSTTDGTSCTLVNQLVGCMDVDPSDNSKCRGCYRGFKLDITLGTCSVSNEILNCIQYESNTGLCEACSIGMVLNEFKTACENINFAAISNCNQHRHNNNTCMRCDTGYYLESPFLCKPQDIDNCLIFKPNENNCIQCKSEYKLENNVCVKLMEIEHCLHYNTSKTACVICDTDYYPEGDKCLKNYLGKCSLKMRNKNKCFGCQENYSLGYSEDCEGIWESPSDSNCLVYIKEKKLCEICKSGFYLEQGVCTAYSLAPTDFQLDPTCEGTFTQDAQCGYCPQGNKSFPISVYKLDKSNYTGCEKVNASTGECTQCLPNYDTMDADKKTCQSSGTSSVCMKLIANAGVGVTIDTAEKCAECRDKSLYYLDNNTCTTKNQMNIEEMYSSDGSPKKCAYESVLKRLKETSTFECGSVNTLTGAALISGCEEYYFEVDTCYKCQYGYKSNVAKTSCTSQSPSVDTTLHIRVDSNNVFEVSDFNEPDTSLNAALLIDVTESSTPEFYPGICLESTDHQRIVSLTDIKNMNYDYGQVIDTPTYASTKVSFANSFPVFSCEPKSTKYLAGSTSDPTIASSGFCAYWAKRGDYLKCLGCIPGYLPAMAETAYEVDGASNSALTPTEEEFKSFIESCISIGVYFLSPPIFTIAALSQDFMGLGYHTNSFLSLSTFIRFDSCTADKFPIIVFAKKSGNFLLPNYVTVSIGATIGPLPNIVCFESNKFGNDYIFDATASPDPTALSGAVPFCQINLWVDQSDMHTNGVVSQQITAADTVPGSRLSCLSCMPGYTGFPTGDKYAPSLEIASCTPIANCTMSASVNTWMNACRTCSTSYAWELTSDNELMFHRCVKPDSGSTTGCLFYKKNASNVYVCSGCVSGMYLWFTPTGTTTCRSKTKFVNCDTIGRSKLTLLPSAKYPKDNALVFQYFINGLFSSKYETCETCLSGVKLYRDYGSTFVNVCTYDFNTQMMKPDNEVPGLDGSCHFYDQEYFKCKLCIDDGSSTRTAMDSSYTCPNKPNSGVLADRVGCSKMTNDGNCLECHEEYNVAYNDSSVALCYNQTELDSEMNCSKLNNSAVCVVCKQGFVPDTTPGNEHMCIAYTTGDCNRLNRNGTCLSCATPNHIPIHYTIPGASADPYYTFVCADQKTVDFDAFILAPVYYDVSSQTLGVLTSNLPNDEFYIKDASKTVYETVTGNNYKDMCFNVFHEPFENCLIASENGIQCNKCKPGYQLVIKTNGHNECIPIFTACLTMHPNGLDCLMCKPEYKMDTATKQCVLRTLVTSEFTYDSDKCLGNYTSDLSCDKCEEGNEALHIKYVERNGTFTDCLVTDPDTKNCTMCDFNSNFTSGNTCSSSTGNNCRLLDYPFTSTATLDSQSCASCNVGYQREHFALTDIYLCYDIRKYPNTIYLTFTPPATMVIAACFGYAKQQTTAPSMNTYECAYYTPFDYINTISGCIAYTTTGACALCAEGKTYNSTDLTCDTIKHKKTPSEDPPTKADTDSFVLLDSNLTLANKASTLNSSVTLLGYQYEIGSFASVQCKYGYRLNTVVYEDDYSDFTKRTPYTPRLYSTGNALDKTSLEFTRSYPGVYCNSYMSGSTVFDMGPIRGTLIDAVNENAVAPESFHCALWETPTFKYKCARCYDGYVAHLTPLLFSTVYDTDNNTHTTTSRTPAANTPSDGGVIFSCHLSSDIGQGSVRNYQGLSYGNLSVYPAGAYLSVDHCTSNNEALVVMGTWGTKGKYDPLIYNTNFTSQAFMSESLILNQFCLTFTTNEYLDNPLPPGTDKYSIGVPGCQINAYEITYNGNSVNTVNKFASTPTLKCLSCRPGYASTYDSDNKFIESCTLIDNCNISSPDNTWMNACKVCDADHTWSFDGANKILELHKCVPKIDADSCLVVSKSNANSCTLCKSGYIINSNGTCVPVSYAEKKGCTSTTNAFPYHYMDMNSSIVDQNEHRALDFISYLYVENSWVFKPECATCDASSVLTKFGTSDSDYCSNHPSFVTWTTAPNIANCVHYDPDDETKCYVCEPNYVVVTGAYNQTKGGSCQDITGTPTTNNPFLPACQAVKDTTNYECVQCKPNMSQVSRNTPGVTDHACYDIENISHLNCARFDYKTETCLVCNENHIFDTTVDSKWCISGTPANDFDCSQPASNGRCLKCKGAQYYPIHWKLSTPENGNDYKFYCIDQGRALNDEYFYIVRGFDLVHNMPLFDTSLIPYNKHYAIPSDYTDYTDSSAFNSFTNLTDLTHVCLKIKDSENFTDCEELGQFGYLCSKCTSPKTLLNKPHNFNECFDGCEVIDPLSHQCVLCSDNTKHTNNQTNACTSTYTSNVDNCNYKSPFADICIYCNAGYYLNSSGQCVQYSHIPNCVNRDRFNDKCVLCADGYTMKEDGTCVMYSRDNCQIVNPDSIFECLACVSGFELVNGNCYRESPLSFICKTRSDDGKCASCFNGYTLRDGACSETYSRMEIKGCLNYDKVGLVCQKCESGLTLVNGRCNYVELSNCDVMSSDGIYCTVCEEGFYLDGAGCTPRKKMNCAEYAKDKDACLSCLANSYLQYGTCITYTAQQCKIYNPLKNECMTCNDNFHFDVASRKCVQSSLNNCQVLNHLNHKCFSCQTGFFLDNLGLCSARTIQTCSQFDPHADSCIDCPEGYYLVEDNGAYVGLTSNSLNTCKPYTLTNCQIYHPHQDQCVSCNEGEFLDGGKRCLTRTMFNCAVWNEEQNQCLSCPEKSYLKHKACHAYSVANCKVYDRNDNACVTCPEKFYLSDKECVPYTVADCIYYESAQDKCVQCAHGFFNQNGTCSKITQNNCSTYAEDKNGCASCKKGYYLQNGVCLSYSISCKDYSSSSNECISCPRGQYLENNNKTCINYSVSNCLTFSAQSNHCETCVANHYFSGGLCLPYTVNNCQVYHSLFDECVNCQSGFYHHKQQCLPYNVSNCSKYSLVSDLCLACKDGHYNAQGNCIAYQLDNCKKPHENQNSCLECESKMFYRMQVKADLFLCKPVSVVEDCDQYEPHQDKCLICEEGYYLDESTNMCHEVPPTVANCSEFSDETTCKSCISPYYLKNNKCHRTDHKISHCVKYLSNSQCAECEQSSILSKDSTLCLKIVEPSCETYINPNNCKTCSGNLVINYINDINGELISGLNGENLSSLRAICTDSGIANCVLARKAFPNNICVKCANGYYVDSNDSCQRITKEIQNCETYFNDGVCSQCTSNHVLSHDKSQCLYDDSFLGRNCQEGKFLSQPQCFMCQTGYYFDSNGDCVPCVLEGCAVCTLHDSASCRVCRQGYYMNEEMRCIRNGRQSLKLQKEIVDTGFEELNESVLTFKEIIMSLVLVMSLFK